MIAHGKAMIPSPLLSLTLILFSLQIEATVTTATTQESAPPLPEYTCKKVSQPIVLSGKLDDPQWNQAPVLTLRNAITGQAGRFATEVRLLYDDDYLYVGFRCEDDYVWGTVTDRDGPIWNEECVEVFLNPAGSAHQYYEINLSPRNVIFDACVLNSRTEQQPAATFVPLLEWQAADMLTATYVDGKLGERGGAKGWTAEYAIPHQILFGAPNRPPQPGDTWRANFYRIDSPESGQREHYAWSRTGREAFHLPWRFGFLRFD